MLVTEGYQQIDSRRKLCNMCAVCCVMGIVLLCNGYCIMCIVFCVMTFMQPALCLLYNGCNNACNVYYDVL